MKGTAIAVLILAPTAVVVTLVFWNAAAEHDRGVLDQREVVAVLGTLTAALAALALLLLFS